MTGSRQSRVLALKLHIYLSSSHFASYLTHFKAKRIINSCVRKIPRMSVFFFIVYRLSFSYQKSYIVSNQYKITTILFYIIFIRIRIQWMQAYYHLIFRLINNHCRPSGNIGIFAKNHVSLRRCLKKIWCSLGE